MTHLGRAFFEMYSNGGIINVIGISVAVKWFIRAMFRGIYPRIWSLLILLSRTPRHSQSADVVIRVIDTTKPNVINHVGKITFVLFGRWLQNIYLYVEGRYVLRNLTPECLCFSVPQQKSFDFFHLPSASEPIFRWPPVITDCTLSLFNCR